MAWPAMEPVADRREHTKEPGNLLVTVGLPQWSPP
jgi:hypothetical protein